MPTETFYLPEYITHSSTDHGPAKNNFVDRDKRVTGKPNHQSSITAGCEKDIKRK